MYGPLILLEPRLYDTMDSLFSIFQIVLLYNPSYYISLSCFNHRVTRFF